MKKILLKFCINCLNATIKIVLFFNFVMFLLIRHRYGIIVKSSLHFFET